MGLIDEIRKKIEIEQFELSKHAVDQSIIRHISVRKLVKSLAMLQRINTDQVV